MSCNNDEILEHISKRVDTIAALVMMNQKVEQQKKALIDAAVVLEVLVAVEPHHPVLSPEMHESAKKAVQSIREALGIDLRKDGE